MSDSEEDGETSGDQLGSRDRKKKRSAAVDFGLVVAAADTITAPCSYPWIMKRFEAAFGNRIGAGGKGCGTCPPCKYML